MRDARPAYRVTDENGAVLVLRSDMTVPIARVVASRYPHVEPPMRFCYFAHCYRAVRPQRGQQREMLQAGIELVGAPAPGGTVEALTVLVDALDATGLADYRIGIGDASLYPALMGSLGVPRRRTARSCCRRSTAATSSPSRNGCRASALDDAAAELLVAHPSDPRRAWGPRRPRGSGRGGHPRLRSVAEQVPAGRRAAAHLRSRPRARHRLLHRRDLRGLRPGAREADRRRRPLRRPARTVRAQPARRRLRARHRRAAHRARRRGARHPAPGRRYPDGGTGDVRPPVAVGE